MAMEKHVEIWTNARQEAILVSTNASIPLDPMSVLAPGDLDRWAIDVSMWMSVLNNRACALDLVLAKILMEASNACVQGVTNWTSRARFALTEMNVKRIRVNVKLPNAETWPDRTSKIMIISQFHRNHISLTFCLDVDALTDLFCTMSIKNVLMPMNV